MVAAQVDSTADTSGGKHHRLDLDAHIPALCLKLGDKIALHAKRHNARDMNLDLCEWRIIQVLGAVQRATIFDIADRIAMDRGGTSRAISRLEDSGLVVRQTDRLDRRRSYIALSESGLAQHALIIQFALAREERLLQKLSPEDRQHLRKMLRLLIDESESMLTQQWTPDSSVSA